MQFYENPGEYEISCYCGKASIDYIAYDCKEFLDFYLSLCYSDLPYDFPYKADDFAAIVKYYEENDLQVTPPPFGENPPYYTEALRTFNVISKNPDYVSDFINTQVKHFSTALKDIQNEINTLNIIQSCSSTIPIGRKQDILLNSIKEAQLKAEYAVKLMESKIEKFAAVNPEAASGYAQMAKDCKAQYEKTISSIPEKIKTPLYLSTEAEFNGKTYMVTTGSLGKNEFTTVVFPTENGEIDYRSETYYEQYTNADDAKAGHERICSEIESIVNDPLSLDYVEPSNPQAAHEENVENQSVDEQLPDDNADFPGDDGCL